MTTNDTTTPTSAAPAATATATTPQGAAVFSSALAPQLARYVEFKTSMGAYGRSRIWYLKQFDAYCLEHDSQVLDKECVEGWVTQRLSRGGSYRSWMSYIRDFGRWMRTHHDREAYVLSDQWKASYVPARPYLLSTAQVEAFFTATAELDCGSPWRWQATAFFTLMHSCGLRTGEVRNLRSEHLDLPARCIDIVATKSGLARRLPITDDIATILAACQHTSRIEHTRTGEYVFFTSTGNQVSPASIGVIFQRIWSAAELAHPASGPQPRPYCFRHHFAYANLHRWMLAGRDVTAMLPYLSRYMGHASIESTYYYVHTSPDFMTDYADITTASSSVLPEVSWS